MSEAEEHETKGGEHSPTSRIENGAQGKIVGFKHHTSTATEVEESCVLDGEHEDGGNDDFVGWDSDDVGEEDDTGESHDPSERVERGNRPSG